MTPPFTLTSRLSRAKYANICLQLALQTDVFLLIPALISALLVLQFLIGIIAQPQELGLGTLVLLVPLIAVSCPLLYLLIKWYKYRGEYDYTYPQLRREIEFAFLEDGFVVKAPDGEAKIEWKEVNMLYRAGGFFILVLRRDNGTYYIDARELSQEQKRFIKNRFFYRYW